MPLKPKVELECSQELFEDIHESLARTRSNSTTVRVNKEALTKLLIDHSVILCEVDHE